MRAAGQPSGGFTLVELMVTLAVLAILLAAAAPSFREFFERYQLRGVADQSLAFLAQARQSAVENDRNITLRLTGAGSQWCIGGVQAAPMAAGALVPTAPAPCDCAAAPNQCIVDGEPFIVSFENAGGAELITGSGASLTYDSKSGALVELGTVPQFEVQSVTGRYGIRIVISPLGQARACIPAGKRTMPGYTTC